MFELVGSLVFDPISAASPSFHLLGSPSKAYGECCSPKPFSSSNLVTLSILLLLF